MMVSRNLWHVGMKIEGGRMASGGGLSVALLTEKQILSGCQRGPSAAQGGADLPRMVICSYDMLHRLMCEACKGSSTAACSGAVVRCSLRHLTDLPAFPRPEIFSAVHASSL